MSNRLLALLILTLIAGAAFGAYWYFFMANVGSLVVTVSDLQDVQVNITTEFKYEKTQTCSSSCIFEGVPPVNIQLTASKKGYDTTTNNFTLSRGEKKVIELTLPKTVILEAKNTDNVDKIELIKLKKNISEDTESGSILPLGIYNGRAYAYKFVDGFSLYSYDENNTRQTIIEVPIVFSEVVWNEFDGIILLKKEDGQSGILEIDTGAYTTLKDLSGAQYAKKGMKQNQLLIRTNDAVSVLDKDIGEIKKDGIYDDYVTLSSGKILGLLRSGSTDKMSLLNLPTDGKTKIILQDQTTHERKVIYSTDDTIVGLIMNSGKVFAIDVSGKSGELKNLEIN